MKKIHTHLCHNVILSVGNNKQPNERGSTMRPTTIRDYAAKYDRDPDNCFAAACFNQNSIPELIAALADDLPDSQDCEIWGIGQDEWRDAIYAALHEKAGGGFAVAVLYHWYNESDTWDWYEDESGSGRESEYGDQTVYSIGTALALRHEILTGGYELSRNESSRPDVYITTVRDMELVRDGEVSWHNDYECPCTNGPVNEPCAEIECPICSQYMTDAEIKYIREHAIQ
jgi:hypothetical protein